MAYRSVALPCLIFAACACTAKAGSAETTDVTYLCADSRSIIVGRNAQMATVRYGDVSYHLARRPSSIGEKYGSRDASLIIDGDFVAFVTEAIPDLEDCRVKPTIGE